MNIACEKKKRSFYDISQRSDEGLETLLSVTLDQYMYTLDRAIVAQYFHLYLIRSFVRFRSFFFVTLVLTSKIE